MANRCAFQRRLVRGRLREILGSDKAAWRKYDVCAALVEDGARFAEFLIDRGKADVFLENGLRPRIFETVLKDTGIGLISVERKCPIPGKIVAKLTFDDRVIS